jgi:protein TonB
MARRKKKLSMVYVVSIGAHLLVGAVLALVPQDKLREVVAITLGDEPEKKKPEPPKPPEHHDAPKPRSMGNHAPHHVAAAAPVPEAANANQAPAFTDIGLALDSSSADGIAVNIAQPAAVVARPEPVKPKVLVAHHDPTECTEELVKARPLSMIKPAYTDDARRARVEGRIRIELMVNENGDVTDARILSGLGHGLDEAALAAARRLHFAPATRCKRPVAAPFIIGMRFALGS